MSNKTLIGETAYEISGGKALVNGTTYSIKNSKTLVNGTAYDVGFDDGKRTLSVRCVDTSLAEITINGSTLDSGTYEVSIGTILNCWVRNENSVQTASIVLNGTTVAFAQSEGKNAEYNLTITKNASVIVNTVNDVGVITITEVTNDMQADVTFTGSGLVSSVYASINQKMYFSEDAVSIPTGTLIYCVAKGSTSEGKKGEIYLNGESVGVSTNIVSVEYYLTVKTNTTIRFEATQTNLLGGYGCIYITEE